MSWIHGGTIWLLAGAALPAAAQELAEQFWAAARKGDAAAIQVLLKKGVDANAKARYERTALSFAAHRGHLEVVQLLLAHGADPNIKDTFYGATALSLAASEGHRPVVKALLDKGAAGGEELLMNAALGGRMELATLVLDRGGVDPETLTAALAVAARNKRADLVALLEKAGARPPPEANFPVDVEILRRYEGSYRSDRGMEFTVAVKDGRLTWALPGRNSIILGAVNPTTFRPAETPEEIITFRLQGDRVTGFTSRRGPMLFEFQKVGADDRK